MKEDKHTLFSGQVPCPKCGRKGVGYASHPHAYGWKDYSKAECRYCMAIFKLKAKYRLTTDFDHGQNNGAE